MVCVVCSFCSCIDVMLFVRRLLSCVSLFVVSVLVYGVVVVGCCLCVCI